jgi:hypothetical protein
MWQPKTSVVVPLAIAGCVVSFFHGQSMHVAQILGLQIKVVASMSSILVHAWAVITGRIPDG